MLQDMDGNDLAFSIHVGDIFWRPCSDDRYERSLRWFNGLKHPLIYVPGDNEWADCWTEQEGGFNPRDRLARLRRTLYPRPAVESGPPDVAARNAVGESGVCRVRRTCPLVARAAWSSRRSMSWAAAISPSGSRRERTPTIRNRAGGSRPRSRGCMRRSRGRSRSRRRRWSCPSTPIQALTVPSRSGARSSRCSTRSKTKPWRSTSPCC